MIGTIRGVRLSRRQVVEVGRLEGRSLQSILALTAEASPTRLRHISLMNLPHPLPSDGFVPVTIAGDLLQTPGQTPSLSFRVFDSQHRVRTTGTIAPMNVGPFLGQERFIYSTRIGLPLARPENDPEGRQYVIVVTAQDQDSTLSAAAAVTVPHRTFPFLAHARVIHATG
jgi:hypothetical protein